MKITYNRPENYKCGCCSDMIEVTEDLDAWLYNRVVGGGIEDQLSRLSRLMSCVLKPVLEKNPELLEEVVYIFENWEETGHVLEKE